MNPNTLVFLLFISVLGACASESSKEPKEITYDKAVGVPFLGIVPVQPATPAVVTGLDASPVYFELDEAELTSDDMDQVAKTARWMKANPNAEVKVEGFTDHFGTVAHNKVLGAKRAQNFKSSLVSYGISSDRVHTVNRGGEPRERAVVITPLAE